jgi:hypothetical protein
VLSKKFSVFGNFNRFNWRSKDFDAETGEFVLQFHSNVEGGLTTKGAVDAFKS